MNMNEVNKILKEHNKKLDAMTFEEKQQFYARYGLKITKENAKRKGKIKKYTK